MSGDDRAPVPVHEGLFTVASDGSVRLLGGRCGTCGEHHFPRTGSCPYCSGDGVTEARLSETGTLWAWTAVTAPPPGYRGGVPFGFGVVELDERLRVITRISEPDPSRLRRGQAMRLEIVPLHDDEEGRPVVTYAFAPAESSTAGGGAGGPRRSEEGGDGAPPGAAKPPADTAGGGAGGPRRPPSARTEEGGDGAPPGAAKPPAGQ